MSWDVNRSLWIWLLAGLLSRLWIAGTLPAGFDEAYYFLYTQHWDWSYFDHPLGVALTAGVGPWLTGYISPLTLRLGGLLLYVGSTRLLYATGRHLFGELVGIRGVAIATLSPLFLLGFGILASPDNGLILAWSAVSYVAAQEFFAPHRSDDCTDGPAYRPTYRPTYRLALIGILLGLACLSKYHGFILGLSLLGFCSTSATYRRALRSPWLGVSLLLFGLVLWPLWSWNFAHDWISFKFHLFSRFQPSGVPAAANGGYQPLNLLGVVLAEVGYLFPSIGLPLWWVSLKTWFQLGWLGPRQRQAWVRSFDGADPQLALKQVFILWLGLPIALGFTLLGGLTHIFPAWPAPGLWSLSLLLALASTRWRAHHVRSGLMATGLTVTFCLSFALAHITLGTLQKPSQFALFGGFVAPEADPSTALIDVVQLRQLLRENSGVMSAIATTDFLFTNEYWLSGYIHMAIRPLTSVPVTAFTPDPRGHAYWFTPTDWLNKTGLLVTIADFDQITLRETYRPYFSQFDLLDTVSTQRGGAVTETFYLYDVGKLLKPYPYPYP